MVHVYVKIHGANEDTVTIQDHEGLASLASIDDRERELIHEYTSYSCRLYNKGK
jgi:hypothetical protein